MLLSKAHISQKNVFKNNFLYVSYSSSNISSFSRIATTLLTSLSSKSWHAIRHWTVIVHLCYRLKTIGSSSTIDTRRWVIIPKHKVSPFTPRLLYSLACLLPHTGQIRRTADPTFSAGSDAEVELSSAVWRTWNESRTTMVFRANTRRALYIYGFALIQWTMTRFCCWVVYVDDVGDAIMQLRNLTMPVDCGS